MKKNRTMRAAVLMLALTLITSCFVGSTFAKYTTGISGNDTARVAKFGVGLAFTAPYAPANAFADSYDAGNVTVQTQVVDQNVIAPGTSGTAFVLVISGAPEVDVDVTMNLGTLTMVTLPKNDEHGTPISYKDYTNATSDTVFTLDADYQPVKWTLKKGAAVVQDDGVPLENVNLQAIDTYLEDHLDGHYDVDGGEFANIVGTYTLTWTWDFEYGNTSDPNYAAKLALINKADTYLGNLAAGTAGIVTPDGYVANESFTLTVIVEQVD